MRHVRSGQPKKGGRLVRVCFESDLELVDAQINGGPVCRNSTELEQRCPCEG